MSLADYFLLLRPFNCMMAGVAAWIGYAMAGGPLAFEEPFFFVFLAAFFVCGAGQAINDYFDRTVDRVLHPNKPLPSGRIKPTHALVFSLAVFVLGIGFAFPLGMTAFSIALGFSILLVLYSAFLPKYKYIGNWVVAAGTAFTLVFGAAAVGRPEAVWLFAAAALFANVSRELIKDLEDVSTDKEFKVTLPMLVSKNNVKFLVLLFYIAAIGFSYQAYLAGLANDYYLGIITLANLTFLVSFVLSARNQFAKAQRAAKAAMLFALVAFASTVV